MTRRTVIVEQPFLEGEPAKAISYLKPDDDWDSGFAIWTSGPDRIGDTALVHLDHIIDDHPELAHGLEYAGRRGEWTDACQQPKSNVM